MYMYYSWFNFGRFLDKIDDHTLFITLSFLCRILEAVGSSAFITSTFTIIACEFPQSIATTFVRFCSDDDVCI
jgi:hypothetical protein